MRIPLLIIILICGTIRAQASNPNLKDILELLEKKHSSIRTLAVELRQEKVFSFMNKPIVSNGFMLFEAPHKIRFDIARPFASSMLDDGTTLLRFEFIDNQWRNVPFGGGKSVKLVMNQIGQWMQGKFANQDKIFAISVSTGDPNDYAVLTLEPHHEQFRKYIEKILIHIAPAPSYRVNYITIQEPQGDSFSMYFYNELIDHDLPKDCFSNPQTADQCLELFNQKERIKLDSNGDQKSIGSASK